MVSVDFDDILFARAKEKLPSSNSLEENSSCLLLGSVAKRLFS